MDIRQVKEKLDRMKCYGNVIWLLLYGIPIGILVGGLDVIFGKVLLDITDFRQQYGMYFLPFLAIVGVGIVRVYERFGKESEKGMGLIFEVGHGQREEIPLRLIPFVVISTWLTHLFGGSAGREGVAVQIGATCSQWFGNKVLKKKNTNIFLIAGIAAGFSGLFGTPLAAVFFALEVLVVGVLQYEALIVAMSAAFVSSATAHICGLEKFSFSLGITIQMTPKLIGVLIGLGVCFGLAGSLFAYVLQYAKKQFGYWIPSKSKRIAIGGILLSILLLLCHQGRYSGLGTNLIQAALHGEPIYGYDWMIKLVLTIVTLAIGFQGGEVTPLFSIGASLGCFLAPFLGIPVVLGAALGYIAVFGSATNTFLAPIFIGAEVFGYEYIPYFFLVCGIAYAVNGNRSIYSLQKVMDK